MTPRNWEQLAYFLAAASTGSFRNAANVLKTSHVNVGRQIKALEGDLGVQLLHRRAKGVELTDAGETLMPLAKEAERHMLQAQRQLTGLDQQLVGDIRFSTSGPLAYCLLPPILAEFARLYPRVNVLTHVSSQLEDPSLIATDVSLRMIYDVQEDAVVRRLFPVGLAVLAHKDYLAETLPNVGPGGAGLTWIGSTPSAARPNLGLDIPFPEASVRPVSDDPLVHLEMISQGLGMAYLGAFMLQSRPGLMVVPGSGIQAGPPLSIIIQPQVRKAARVRRFVDFLAAEIHKRKDVLQAASPDLTLAPSQPDEVTA